MIFVFTIGSLHWSVSASYQQRDGVQQCTSGGGDRDRIWRTWSVGKGERGEKRKRRGKVKREGWGKKGEEGKEGEGGRWPPELVSRRVLWSFVARFHPPAQKYLTKRREFVVAFIEGAPFISSMRREVILKWVIYSGEGAGMVAGKFNAETIWRNVNSMLKQFWGEIEREEKDFEA